MYSIMKYYCALLGIYALILMYYIRTLFSIDCDGLFGCLGILLFTFPISIILLCVFGAGFFKLFKAICSNLVSVSEKTKAYQNIVGWTIIPIVVFSLLLSLYIGFRIL